MKFDVMKSNAFQVKEVESKIRHFREHSDVQLKNARLYISEIFTDWFVQTDSTFDRCVQKTFCQTLASQTEK